MDHNKLMFIAKYIGSQKDQKFTKEIERTYNWHGVPNELLDVKIDC